MIVGLSSEAASTIAFLGALGVTAAMVPAVRRIAVRTDFLDHPSGYKKHPRATPYLGGTALVIGFLAGSVALGDEWSGFVPVICGVLVLCLVGTVDDRVNLGIRLRLAVEISVAFAIWAFGFGWDIGHPIPDAALTIVWVVGLVNAFNLMDNLDGAAGTVAAVSSAGAATIAAGQGDWALAVIGFSLAGACAGFLPFNLARPSRIFLGDGGSMPAGLVVAAVLMNIPHEGSGWASVLAAVPLAGLPILDTALVVLSRRRRGVEVLSGGRDHLTHRLLARLGTARRVALALALAQSALCLLGAFLFQVDDTAVLMLAAAYVVAGCATVAAFESGALRPSGSAPAVSA